MADDSRPEDAPLGDDRPATAGGTPAAPSEAAPAGTAARPVETPFSLADDDWESELAAWDAAIPIVTRNPIVTAPEPAPVEPRALAGEGAMPETDNPFLETPTTVVSQGQLLDLEDLPDLISAGTFDGGVAPASGSYAALVTTDQSAPGIFDRDPVAEEPPAFTTDVSPDLQTAPWVNDIRNLIAAGTAGPPVPPARATFEALERLMAEERSWERSFGGDVRRSVALGLGAARIAELLGHPKEALAHVEATLALDSASPAAHRARLGLAERTGRLDDEGAAESLARLALTPHADQAYYRALYAEWILARASRGIVDGTAAAAIAGLPDGLGRMLAEAELAWREPPVAAAILENAAHRVGGPLGAALLSCAAGLNEVARDFQSAAEQRFVAARLDDRPALVSLGVLRDLARVEPEAAVPGLEDLLTKVPPSALRVALARWGAAAARRAGDGTRAWGFVAEAESLGPLTAALARDRLDLWPNAPATESSPPVESVFGPLAQFWSTPFARQVQALRACERSDSAEAIATAVAIAEEAVAVADTTWDPVGLAAALEDLARRASDPALRLRALRLWRAADPARWTSASLDLADAMAPAATEPGSQSSGPESTESVLGEIAVRDGSSPVFWALAALAAWRGRFVDAAAYIDRGLEQAAWRDSPLAAPLAELAAELTARADLGAAVDRLARGRTRTVPTAAQRLTLGRMLRQLGDRDLWAEFVGEEISAGATEGQSQRDRSRKAALLLEPVFWRTEAGDGEDVPSLVSAALDVFPLHPVALGLALGDRPVPALLVDRFAAGSGGPGGATWALSASVAATVAGDAPRALALAMEARRALREAPAGNPAALLTAEAARATARRLAWAAPDVERAAGTRRELADADAPVEILLDAAETAEGVGDVAEARRWFEAAATAAGHSAVDADIRAGLSRLSGRDTRLAWQSTVDDGASASRDPARDGDRLISLGQAAAARRWPEVVARLVDAPPHEETSGAATLALAAAIDDGRCGGGRGRELWARARAALGGAGTAPGPGVSPQSAAAGTEPVPLVRASDPVDADPGEVGAALEQLAARLVRTPDRRSAALFLEEAAHLEASRADVDPDAARVTERRLRAAVEHDPTSALAAMDWRRWLSAAGRIDEAALASAAEAEALVDPTLRVQALLRAAASLGTPAGAGPNLDRPVDDHTRESTSRTATFLHRALEIAPHDPEAFARLRDLYDETGRHHDLARLLAVRLTVTTNPFEVTALHLARADLFAGPLGDRASAKAELETILNKEPQHARALARLADLEQEDGHDAAAADLLIRRAFIERSPEKLRELFLRLGRIYTQRMPDPKRAVGAYARVLQLDVNNREALDELSRLYLGLGETKSAMAITERLVRIETAPERRSVYHVRLGRLAERGGDPRTAAFHFRRAAEEAPRDIEALGELVRYLEKIRDVSGRRAHLDRVAVDLRAAVLADPADRPAIDALVAVLRWRGRTAAAAAAAELAALVGTRAVWDGTVDDWGALSVPAWATPPAGGRRLSALSKPLLDEQTFPASVPPSVRQLFLLLGPALAEGKADPSQYGVDRSDRVSPGRPPRDVFEGIAAELSAGPFELYLARGTASGPRPPLVVQPGRPTALVVGAALIAMGEPIVRFVAGRALRLSATHLDMALVGPRAELGAWIGGIVRQFLPEYVHPDVATGAIAERAARVAKLMPRRLRQEIMPFAMESSGQLDLEAVRAGIRAGANRVGLLASGSLAAALGVIMAVSAEAGGVPGVAASSLSRNAEARELLVFALSDEYDELVKALE